MIKNDVTLRGVGARIIDFSWDCAWCASFVCHLAVGIAAAYLQRKPPRAEPGVDSTISWMVSAKENEERTKTPRNSSLDGKEYAAAPALCSPEPETRVLDPEAVTPEIAVHATVPVWTTVEAASANQMNARAIKSKNPGTSSILMSILSDRLDSDAR